MRRAMGYAIAASGLVCWGYGVYLLVDGNTDRGLIFAGVGAVALLVLAWLRGAFWLPDGGGP